MAALIVTVGQREIRELPKRGKQRLLPDKGPEDARGYGELLLAMINEGGETVLSELGAPMVEPAVKWLAQQSDPIEAVALVCTDQSATNPDMAKTDTEPMAEVLKLLLTYRYPNLHPKNICLKNVNPANDEHVAPAIREAFRSLASDLAGKCYVLPQGGTPAMKYHSIFALLDLGYDAVALRAVPTPGDFYSRIEINQHVPDLVSKRTVLGNMLTEVRRLCQAEDFAGAASVIEAYPTLFDKYSTLALIARLGRLVQAWNFEGLRTLVGDHREVLLKLNATLYPWLCRLLNGGYAEAFQVSLAEIRTALENGCAVLAMARYYNALELACASRLEHLWAFGPLSHESIDRFLAEKLPQGFSRAKFGEMRCAADSMPPTWRLLESGREVCSASVPRKAERILACFGPNSSQNCPLPQFNRRYSMYRALRVLMGRIEPGDEANPVRFRHEGPYAHDSRSISVETLWEAFKNFSNRLAASGSPPIKKLYLAVGQASSVYGWIHHAFEACELPVSVDPYRELRKLAENV